MSGSTSLADGYGPRSAAAAVLAFGISIWRRTEGDTKTPEIVFIRTKGIDSCA